MGFSKSSKYTYKSLSTKYNNFHNPTFEIMVDGAELTKNKYIISDLVVDLPVTIGGVRRCEAGSCTFTISHMYDLETDSFDYNAAKKVEFGKKLEVKLGYTSLITVFTGYIAVVEVTYSEKATKIVVTGMDGISLLHNSKRLENFNQKEPSKTINKLFGNCTTGGIAKIGTVDNIQSFEVDLSIMGVDDSEFLMMLARRTKKTLALISNDLMFTDLLSNKTPIIELKWGESLKSFTKEVDGSRQIGMVKAYGYKLDHSPISVTVKDVTVGGAGKTASDLSKAVKAKVHEISDSIAQTTEELKTLAESILDEISMGFVSGKGTCVGIPDLIPGRYIEIGDVDGTSAGTFFITRIVHKVDSEGFLTTFEIKGAKTL